MLAHVTPGLLVLPNQEALKKAKEAVAMLERGSGLKREGVPRTWGGQYTGANWYGGREREDCGA